MGGVEKIEAIRAAVRDASMEEICTALRAEWGDCCSLTSAMVFYFPELRHAA